MILMLSGEGPDDMGCCKNQRDTCQGDDFEPGPMAMLVDKIVEPVWNYSPRDAGALDFVPEHTLAVYCRDRLETALPGKNRPADTRYFFKNARGLARISKQKAAEAQCPVGAVFFRDSDGTRSDDAGLWQSKVNSVELGFAYENFDFGVAMIPRPKSEAWLLCAIKANAYQNCAPLEDAPGNDGSPNNLKGQLDSALQVMGKTLDDIIPMIEAGQIDAARIDMPSYNRFRLRMQNVAENMKR